MIFAHTIVGLMPVVDNQFNWFWFLGSVVVDLDHLFVLCRHRIFSPHRAWQIAKNEEQYGIRFKTKYMHSVFGAVASSLLVSLIDPAGAVYFFLAYILHLLLDWLDRDEKQYLYPLKIKFRGFLPIFSKWEQLFTVVLAVVLILTYLK